MSDRHERRPAHRFTRRVQDYVRYRPTYPPELLAWLRDTVGFDASWRVADIGSGTGFFSRLLLEHGNRVHAVEPNDRMRAEAESSLGRYPDFASVKAAAEATTLPDRSFDLVTAAQSFHWFDPAAARREFERILRPGGHVLIVFNSRRHDASEFMRAYDELLLTRSADYAAVDHRLVYDGRLDAFLGEHRRWRRDFSVFHDREGMLGLTASSSYAPAPGHPAHDGFYRALHELIETHQVDGKVEVHYVTEAFLATFAHGS